MAQGDPVHCRRSDERGAPDDGVYQGHDDAHNEGGEHHAHLLVGGGAPDLLHDDALEAPAKCGNEPNEYGTHDASLMECD